VQLVGVTAILALTPRPENPSTTLQVFSNFSIFNLKKPSIFENKIFKPFIFENSPSFL
jgi:hypothetical protein